MITGYYYLHTNGELIYKRYSEGMVADLRDSDFVIALWPVDPADRSAAWRIIVEALAAGANKERIEELAQKWGCNDDDGLIYAQFVGCDLYKDDTSWRATRLDFNKDLNDPCGVGDTAYKALADLCKNMGYRPTKMWGHTFELLLKKSSPPGV